MASATNDLPATRPQGLLGSSDLRRLARVLSWPLLVLNGAFVFPISQAEQAVNWRIFRASDGLKDSQATAVTLSPRGNVWIKHGESDEISVFDGYTMRTVPSPGKDTRDTYRVYESRTGQLWSLSTNGLVVYDGNQWVRHPVAEILKEIQSNPNRQVREIPLLPIQQNRVLFLLSESLMEYDAARRETTVLKYASETGLGRFLEMIEAREGTKDGEGGIWITGANGLAKVTGPPRQISADSRWEIQIIRDRLHVENLQRPFEDDQGAVTTVAMDSLPSHQRVLLRFDGSSWQKHSVEGEAIRQAWPGWDQSIWAFTVNSLLRFNRETQFAMGRGRIWLGQYKDVAVETNGVFWLGTSEGLARAAPFCWRTPVGIQDVESLVHAAIEDAEGRLWFASTDSLILLRDGAWKRFKWPEGFEGDFQPTDGLYPLRDGRIAIAANDRPLVFDPATEEFQPVIHPEQRKVRLIGARKGGSLWAQTRDATSTAWDAYRLELFDGLTFVPWDGFPGERTLTGELVFAHESQNGDVWLGGAGGIGVHRNGRFQTFGPAQGFLVGKPFCLAEFPDGRIWCGGTSRIFEFNGQRWSIVRSGLERVNGIVRARSGRIWVSTAGGIYCYWLGSWVMNGVEEGLPGAAISKVLEDRHGRIWTGSARGISLYHPDADPEPPRTLRPRPSDPRKPSTEGPVTFEFAAIDKWRSTPSERLLFSHRLDEGQWSPYTNAAVQSWANLRAGKHRMEVRAMDRNWNEDPSFALTEFSVVIPWYRDPRLIGISIGGMVLVLLFAGLAVNRHLRLIRSHAEVEEIVAVRTRELERANEELLQSQKMRALGTLAAGIAHDFNNILSIIKGSAQIIESHLEDKEKIRTRVNRIKTVVEQGSGIVKSMLGLSRVREQDLVWCDLTAVVDETVKLLGDRFLHEVTIRLEEGHGLPPVRGAKELIQQSLVNLILNGADAMMGTGEIVVRTGQTGEVPPELAVSPAKAQRYVYVAVEDFGGGIAPDVLSRIFEPFFTTKALSTRRGTGLGLSMVYELAKEMGYGLKVQTQVGKGSTFTIFIPVQPPGGSFKPPAES